VYQNSYTKIPPKATLTNLSKTSWCMQVHW